MTKLIINQKQLFNDSEKLLFNLFNKDFLNKTTYSSLQSKKSFTKKLRDVHFNNYFEELFAIIKKIEENVDEKHAVKYLEGYLEYNNISFNEISSLTEKYEYVI